MGEHRGWMVYEDRGAWVGRPWNPQTQRYEQSKRFKTEAQAKAHGKQQHAIFCTRLQALAREPVKQLVEKHLADLTRRKRSESHLRDVKLVLDRFARAVPDLSHPRVYHQAVAWLAGYPDHAPATRNRYIVTVRGLCTWAVEHRYLTHHPLLALKEEATDSPIKDQFSVDELRTIVAAAHDPYHPRACLMLYAGLRSDEAANVTWAGVDHNGRVIDIRLGAYRLKRRKERVVALQDELAAVLDCYRDREGVLAPREQVNTSREFIAYLDRLGLPKRGRTPHSLRHCYAGMMTATGVPSLLVAAYMGHDSTQTTAEYARLATRYVAGVKGWPMGQFRLLEGAVSEWRCAWPRG